MSQKALVPWAMPALGKEVLSRAGVEMVPLHGPKGQLPAIEELIEAVRHVHVLISRALQSVPREVIAANSDLLGISNYGVGFNNIDVACATQLGIPVTNTPEVLTETTADLAWALLMATARKVPQAHYFTVSGQWEGPVGETLMGMDIGPGGSNRRKVLGIIGFGRIGQTVMRRSRGFKMKVVAYDPYLRETIEGMKGVEYRELDDLLRESDFVTLHCPLTEQTHHLIGRRQLDLMKPTAILINTSRGPVVDEKALIWALKEEKIKGAGLDVYEEEPRISPDLLQLDSVVLLPHVGSATKDTRVQMAVAAAKNAVTLLRGKRPAHVVNPHVFESSEYLRKVREKGRAPKPG